MTMDWRGIGLCLAVSFLISSAYATKLPDENPGKFGGHYEGDMVLNNASGAQSGDQAFRGNQDWLWPDGIVYYRLSSTIKRNATRSSMITEAMSDITQDAPCINFIDIEEDGINVGSFVDIVTHGDAKLEVSGRGCHSEVGFQGRRQILNLQPDKCFHSPTIKHELFHTLGCVHEHSRPDVAEALDIFIKNVKPNLRNNFRVEKYEAEDVDKGVFDFNTPYDILSIMQYPSHAFAFNDSLKTMQSKDPAFHNQFGLSEDFSVIDIVELNLSYGCSMTTRLVFDYTNAFMDIIISRRRMDKIALAKLKQLHQVDQGRIDKLESQNVTNQDKITNLESQSVKDQGKITKLESQSVIDQGKITKLESQSVIDQGKITKLESQSVTDQGKITKLESQSVKDQGKITKLESQSVTDQGKITKLERQGVTDQSKITKLEGQSVIDQGKIIKLESQTVKDQGKIAKLESQSVINQGKITKLESQSVIYQGKITKLESQSVVDQGQITRVESQIIKLEGQALVDQEKRKEDQDRFSKLENLIKATVFKSCVNGMNVATMIIEGRTVEVRCEDGVGMEGAWTVVQRRGQFGNSQDYFYRDFSDYENGFGSVDGELWLGLKNIVALTSSGSWEMQVDLTDWDGTMYQAVYGSFSVGPPPTYRLGVSRFQDAKSTLGDSLAYHQGKAFTTKDKDQDGWGSNCAQYRKGAWWFNACAHSNLNGLNFGHQQYKSHQGIVWNHGKARGNSQYWQASVIKMRKVNV